MTKAAFHMMGMNCYKCRVSMGAICIPAGANETPESMIRLFASKNMLPICEKCINANPMSYSQESLLKDI